MLRKILPALAAMLGLTALANETGLAQPAAMPDTGAPSACGPPVLADKAALKPVAGSHLMTVPVEINGTPKQFLLGLGSEPDEIAQSAADELNLARADRGPVSNAMGLQGSQLQFQPRFVDVRGAAAKSNPSRVRVSSFTIGQATLPGMQFLISSDRDLGRSKPYDGILTASGFRHYDIALDFAGGTLSFLEPSACADANRIVPWPHAAVAVIPVTLAGGKISVPVTIEGRRIDAVLDTGSDHSVMRRAVAERLFGFKAGTPDMMADPDLRDGAGERVWRHTFPQIALEGVVAGNVPVLIQTNSMVRKARRAATTGSRLQSDEDAGETIPDLTLGMDVLGQLHLYVAFGQNRIYATPAG
jgi:hypothetical protein